MSEHENRPRDDEESESEKTIDDLDVPEEQSADVAGGLKMNYGADESAKI